jgi:predicted DNA-binding transcriptional regulator YafY
VPEDRFERLANLVTFLLDAGERGRGVTYAEIVSMIPGYPPGDDTRRRAFERDKQLLREEDLPLVEDGGRYHIPPGEYYLPDLELTEEEDLALLLAVAAVPWAGGDADAALRKLGVGASDDVMGAGPSALADLDEHPLLPVLHGAIRRRSTVRFAYGRADRDVEPQALFFREGRWYLVAHDLGRDAARTFRVDRIDDGQVEVGPAGGFERRPRTGQDGRPAPREPWLWLGGEDDEPVDAVVRVDAVRAAKAVADAGGSATVERHDDGSVTLTMPVAQRSSFRSWVLGFLDHAEVVGPPDVRAEVRAWLERMAG